MWNPSGSDQLENQRPKVHRFVPWLLAGIVLVGVLMACHSSPADPRCKDILEHPVGDVVIPLPENCMLTPDAPADEKLKYFENERKRRGLDFKAWIVCNPSPRVQPIEFTYTHDLRWLPSY